jgi:glycosyltransferase A (GT-A) superfamily protein (DUF2064 family)
VPQHELFTEVAMSSADTCTQTAARARERGLSVVCLATTYDVDVEADLTRLSGDLAARAARSGRDRTGDPEFPERIYAVLRARLA